jgi:hypothetical protein
MNELQLQAEIFKWHWNNIPEERGLLFHVNNKARNKIEGNKFKSLGVIAGVTDLIYLKPGGRPIFVELKTEEGKQSPQQKEWQKTVESAGYDYRICRDLETFKTYIK